MWCWLRAARNRRDAASQKKQRKKERKKEREKKVIVVAADDRNGVAALLVSHFCCPCFQNHSALAPHSFFSFFFRTARANKRPVRANKKKGWETRRATGKRGCHCAQLRRDCRHRMQLFRNGDLVTGRISTWTKLVASTLSYTAGPGNGEILFPIDLATARRDDDYVHT